MNIIEQLVGYEKAKEVYENFKDDSSSLNRQHALNVKIAMLEHRRQHNISEVGDAMIIPSRGNGIFHFNALFSDSDIAEARHATAGEEIKAGKRLEVS